MKTTLGYLAAAIVVIAFSSVAHGVCNSYPNSFPQYAPGYGGYSGGTGPGCTECVDGSYNSCVTDGATCEPLNITP